MKVIVCGAGQVGFGIAERLSREQNDVTVVDSSDELIQMITDRLDVRGFVGHAAHPDDLQRAGAEDADMLIAATFTDEVNMMACQVAHSLFEIPTKVARVRAQSYLQPVWQSLFSRDHVPIDVVISPEIAAGEMVLRRLALPGAFETLHFVEGIVSVVGVICENDCPIIDTPLRQLTELFPDLTAVVIGISRQGKIFIPHGGDQMLAGDEVFFAAARDQVPRTLKIFGHEEIQARRIVIAGGGNIGLYVARRLEERGQDVRLKMIEADHTRAVEIAERLKRAVVLHGSALDQEILREAGIGEVEEFIALTNDDQINILSCVMAKREGAARTASLINNTDYNDTVRSLGIDTIINPKATTVSSILRHVRRGRIRGVYSVMNGAAEIIEAEALETSSLVGQPLREAQLPDGMRIGAIVRNQKVIMPDGNTQIEAHDRIVMFVLAEQVREVEHMFRVSLEFF